MHSIWLAAVVVACLLLAGGGYRRRRNETRSLKQLARRKGLTFAPVDLIGLHERYYNLDLIRQGHSRHAWNVLYGAMDVGLAAMFRYRYDLGLGVDRSSRHFWLAVLELPAPLPFEFAAESDPSVSSLGDDSAASSRDAAAREDGSEAGLRVGCFSVRTEQAECNRLFEHPLVHTAMMAFPVGWQIESYGNLLAVAAPWNQATALPERLLDSIRELAGALSHAVNEIRRVPQ